MMGWSAGAELTHTGGFGRQIVNPALPLLAPSTLSATPG
jgi:hypothetical protein